MVVGMEDTEVVMAGAPALHEGLAIARDTTTTIGRVPGRGFTTE